MSSRDRRQLKARIEQHRAPPEAPTVPAEIPNDASMARLESAGLLFSGTAAHDRQEARPLTVEFVAMRLLEATIRKEGRNALDAVVTQNCVNAALKMLREARRD